MTAPSPPPVRVLVVDDSALVRRAMTDALSHDPAIEVVGTAVDPYAARDKIIQLDPDVLTLDIEMPRMDGLTFLRLLMRSRPMPVIIMSSLTPTGSAKALEALQEGAVEVLPKPSGSFSIYEDGVRLAERIKAVARARLPVRHTLTPPAPTVPPPHGDPHFKPVRPANPSRPPDQGIPRRRYSSRALIVMGASTGGTEALRTILTALPADLPGILIVQHIPAHFSLAFANRLNELCQLEVREARMGDRLAPGLALIAPGGYHLLARYCGDHYQAVLSESPPVHHQRPAVDVLFDSVVRAGTANHTLAVLLTGMGTDGAAGMLSLRQHGAITLAQNEETCVVYGMPREAVRLDAVQSVLPLESIAPAVDAHATRSASARV